MEFRTDCRHWRGDKPCRENRLCEGCPAYTPLGPRILLIKLGARGDVLRTTPLVTALKTRHPDAHLTWLTRPESVELLAGDPWIDRVLAFSTAGVVEILSRRFEAVYCLDKEPEATGLAVLAKAERKAGWGMAPDAAGTPAALNPDAGYSLALGVSDDLKFRRNRATYLEIVFAALGLDYQGETYRYVPTEADRESARRFFRGRRLRPVGPRGGRVLGLFTGCGPAYTRKRWTEAGFARLAARAVKTLGARVLLMCGPGEEAINARIRRRAKLPLWDTKGRHTLRELAGYLEACRVVVTGDTVALHLALAMKRRVVALFGPTCSQEIDMFGLGRKLAAPVPCAPCYRRTCEISPTCMESLSVDEVWEAVRQEWERAS